MTIDLKNTHAFQKGNEKQSVFTITPTILRQNLGEVLDRVMYCKPPHVAYVLRRGKLVAILKLPEGM